jgi:hypothetical protein
VALQIGAASIAIRRFRTLNGAGVSGFCGPRATWPVLAVFVAVLILLIVGAIALMVDDHPVLSLPVALSALPLTAIVDR